MLKGYPADHGDQHAMKEVYKAQQMYGLDEEYIKYKKEKEKVKKKSRMPKEPKKSKESKEAFCKEAFPHNKDNTYTTLWEENEGILILFVSINDFYSSAISAKVFKI